MAFNHLISVVRTRRTNRSYLPLIVIEIVIIICIECTTRVSSESQALKNMKIIPFNTEPLFRVIVNRVNNDVIVGGRNAVYRLAIDGDGLRKVDEFRTGPINDSVNCLPKVDNCGHNTNLVNNDNKILVINYENRDSSGRPSPLVLACGDGHQGQCIMFKSNNLSLNKPYGSPNDTLSFVGSKTSSYAFFASSATAKGVLYVANAYDGRPLEFSPPSISSRKLNGYNGFKLAHDSGASLTKVDFDPKFKKTFNVKYIFGFNYSHYSYFVSTQPTSVRDTQEYETKLIRVCQKDNEFFSYMEIPLVCREERKSNRSDDHSRKRSFDYLIANTAYLGKIGPKNYNNLNIRDDSETETLYVSMGVKSHGMAINKTIGSAICAFSLKQINKAFTEAAKECFRGGNEVHILELIKGKKESCKRLTAEVTDDFCGTGLNPYIGSNRPLNGLFLTSIKGHVTSLAVGVQNQKTVAAVGTHDGFIRKVLIDEHSDSERPLFEYNISDGSVDPSIRPDPAFDNKGKYLYLLSSNQMFKFPFGSCSIHTDCASCLEGTDPLNCGWCGSSCATDDECQYPTLMSRSMCPPEILNFTPKTGPLMGGTIVTINGDNLGRRHNSEENSKIQITVAGTDCPVIDWQSKQVRCRTGGVPKGVSGRVVVKVHDLTGGIERPYDINGTTVSSDEFRYLEPELKGVNPSFGPYDGGTSVAIVGTNLHIGYNRTIYLAGIKCKEIENNSTFLGCISGPKLVSLFSASDDTSVRVFIDSNEFIINQNKTIRGPEPRDKSLFSSVQPIANQWSEYFQYKPNPKIFSYEPKATIRSGNVNITVIGVNLNSVYNPRMRITAYYSGTGNAIRADSDCLVNSAGTQMVCPTPKINESIATETHLSFVLDGVKSYGLNAQTPTAILNYYSDPEFHALSERTKVVFLEEMDLEINGKDLRNEYPIDIRVGKHDILCKLANKSRSSSAEIHCLIESNEMFKDDGNEHIVRIRVGNIRFSPGHIKFGHRPTIMGAGLIFLLTVVPIVLISGIAALIYIYLKRNGVIQKKVPLPTAYFTAQENGTGGRPPYMSQPSNNNYTREEVTNLLPVVPFPVIRYEVSEETMTLLRADHILIDRINLTLEHVIGQGHFGSVFKGILHSTEKDLDREVAAKCLHSSIIRDDSDIDMFLKEGLMMKDFAHHHVLTLIGVCFEDEGTPIVVLPYMANGDLLSYIRDEKNNPTVKNLLMFAIEIAKGMDYLCGEKFVHRDLAARNCMLDSDLCVKVADFGLSRDIYETDYYRSDNKKNKLPVKWMAPESLEKGTYNTKTDVWSYGVLVWELLTRGVTPYPDVDNWEILNYLKEGRRMPRPAFCPELLYFILLRCWSVDSKQRPSFADLVVEVEGVITRLEKGVQKQTVELEKCNVYINYPVVSTYYNESHSKTNDKDLNESQPSSSYETTC